MCPGPMAYAAFPKLALDQGQRPQAIPNVLNRVSWAGGWQSEPRGSKSSSAFLPSHSCPPRGSIRPFATGWQRCLRLLKRHTQYTSFSVRPAASRPPEQRRGLRPQLRPCSLCSRRPNLRLQLTLRLVHFVPRLAQLTRGAVRPLEAQRILNWFVVNIIPGERVCYQNSQTTSILGPKVGSSYLFSQRLCFSWSLPSLFSASFILPQMK